MERIKVMIKELHTMVRYGFVGIINTAVTGLIFLGLKLLGFPYMLYTFIGYLIGITGSFFLNRHFTFRKTSGDFKGQACRFFCITLSLMLFTLLLQYLLIDVAGLPEWMGVITAMLFYTTLGYVLNRNVVFRHNK